jgi:hypothetical protein
VKNKILIVSIAVLALVLTGCQKKTATVAIPATQSATTGGAGEPSTPATTGSQTASGTPESPVASGALTADQIEAYFKQNYEIATQVSATPLKNQAQFCTAKIEFSSYDLMSKADQYFFFTSPEEKLKSWYWVVHFNQLKGKRYRYFAAKRDFENEITCRANHDLPTLGFATAYNTYLSANQGSYVGTSSAVRNVVTLDTNSWKIELYDAAGQMISSQQIDASSQANQTAVTSPATSL